MFRERPTRVAGALGSFKSWFTASLYPSSLIAPPVSVPPLTCFWTQCSNMLFFFYEKSFFNNTNFRYKKFNENREVSFFSLCTHTPFLHEPRLYPIKSHAPRRHALADGIRTLLSCEVVPGASSVLLRGVGRRTFLHRALVLDDSTDLRPGNTRGCISSRLHKKVRRFQKKTHTR